MITKFFFFISFFILLQLASYSQKKDSMVVTKDSVILKKTDKDSLAKNTVSKKDTLAKKKSDPTRATLYSTIFPGLGQIYNKKYWKLPIVWAAVGIPAYTFFDNKRWYNKTRYALAVFVNGSFNNKDSFSRVDPKLKGLFFYSDGTLNLNAGSALKNYRDYFRKNQDYSVLFFLLFYALNIVDATVDAHLKDFNVSSDLSLNVKPCIIEGTNAGGFSLVLDIHKARPRPLFDNR